MLSNNFRHIQIFKEKFLHNEKYQSVNKRSKIRLLLKPSLFLKNIKYDNLFLIKYK